MTEHPEKSTADNAAPVAPSTEPLPAPTISRWDRVRSRGRLGQIAALMVAIAAAVFIVGSIFVAGYALGAEGGGEHHGHGDGYIQSEGGHRGDGEGSGDSDDGSNEDRQSDDSSDGGGPEGHG